MNTKTTLELTGAQKRFLKGYRPSMKRRVLFHLEHILEECRPTSIEQKHIMESILRAYFDYEKDYSANPSSTFSQAITEYRNGNWRSSGELLDELRSKISQAG